MAPWGQHGMNHGKIQGKIGFTQKLRDFPMDVFQQLILGKQYRVNQPYKIDGPCHPLIVTLRMVYYCFTNMVISPFESFFFYSGSNCLNKNIRRELGDIINFWEGRQTPQIIALIAQSYCVILPEKARLDPDVAETKNCEYWGWPTRSHKARPRGLRRTSAPPLRLAVESGRVLGLSRNGGSESHNLWRI